VGEGTGEPVSDATERIKRSVEGEIERAKQTGTEAKAAFQASVEYVSGPPADSPEQAREQLSSLRTGLEKDLATLAARVPDPDELKARARSLAVPAGIGVVVVGTAGLVLRRRRAHRREAETIRAQAAALARELARVQQAAAELPETPEPRSRGRWLLLLAGLAAGGVVVWQSRRSGGTGPEGPPPLPAMAVPPATPATSEPPPGDTAATATPATSEPPPGPTAAP
jgi:hypothetical protein